jgi:hypothetical protein
MKTWSTITAVLACTGKTKAARRATRRTTAAASALAAVAGEIRSSKTTAFTPACSVTRTRPSDIVELAVTLRDPVDVDELVVEPVSDAVAVRVEVQTLSLAAAAAECAALAVVSPESSADALGAPLIDGEPLSERDRVGGALVLGDCDARAEAEADPLALREAVRAPAADMVAVRAGEALGLAGADAVPVAVAGALGGALPLDDAVGAGPSVGATVIVREPVAPPDRLGTMPALVVALATAVADVHGEPSDDTVPM